MPFEKGNQWAKKPEEGIQLSSRKDHWATIVQWLVGEGGKMYLGILQRLAIGEYVSREQKEYLEHFEGLLEYHKPKLARTETKVEFEGKRFFLGLPRKQIQEELESTVRTVESTVHLEDGGVE